ncbi:MAG: sulfurtransferase [Gammaproteobacteria bacterium]|nr:sulfurtransferase [Gammaproteobacteria bacterium]MBU1441501.1 sulfurtransferase [Gammaproteobacteria bacterium]MBU2286791.1 sulfurtransferase [Gammaproteobacteria bacterium]MBU2411059.1 sulfurtransferase [Gammaproteobacteria bacterium]
MYTTLITASEVMALRDDGAPLMIFDCSFDLMKPEAGASAFGEAHIPGSVHADIEADLSARHGAPGPHGVVVAQDDGVPASGGRHPLPNREKFATWLSSVGFDNAMQAVVLDRNGSLYAGRLWWMLKWMGHEAAAVLDGGLQAWQAAGGPVTDQPETAHFQTNFVTGEPLVTLVDTHTVASRLDAPSAQTLVDARAAARYRGEVEPLDPIAGHIPGALNRPYTENLAADGKFKPADQLRAEFTRLLDGRDPATVVHQCGSGVSAIPNLLAMQVAGLGPTGLYAGSWSEWSNTPGLPTRQGAQP